MSKEKYIQFFRESDKDGSGTITMVELMKVLREKGYAGTDAKIKKMFMDIDTSGDGQISMDEYLVGMGVMPPEEHKSAIMRNVFRGFDKNGDGEIDKAELKNVFQEMGRHLSADEVDRLFKLCDSDGSGHIEYEEFIVKVFGKRA